MGNIRRGREAKQVRQRAALSRLEESIIPYWENRLAQAKGVNANPLRLKELERTIEKSKAQVETLKERVR